MKETPILFSSEMVRAILEGRKSQTRRVIKPQPPEYCDYFAIRGDEPERFRGYMRPGEPTDFLLPKYPYGQSGDRLILLCTWAVPKEFDQVKPSQLPEDVRLWSLFDGEKPEWTGRLRPGRYMPKWMRSRMPKGEVDEVRIERVQEITPWDAVCEGIETIDGRTYREGDYEAYWKNYMFPEEPELYWNTPEDSFHSLWDSINAKRGFGWNVNPWVWVIEFHQIGGL